MDDDWVKVTITIDCPEDNEESVAGETPRP